MLKVRVQGLPTEVRDFADALERAGMVLERSDPYANRGRSKYVRVYLDVDVPRHTDALSDERTSLVADGMRQIEE